jgi:choline kinase
MLALTGVAMLLGMGSCYTERTAQKQVDKAHHRYPAVPAKFCSEKYPPTDSVSMVKEYIQGEDFVFADTLLEIHHLRDTTVLTKYITKTIRTTDTLRDTKYVQQENKALVSLKEAEIKNLNKNLTSATNSRDNWRRWALVFGGILLLYTTFRIVRYYFLRK